MMVKSPPHSGLPRSVAERIDDERTPEQRSHLRVTVATRPSGRVSRVHALTTLRSLSALKERHEPEVHVYLLVTVKER